MLREWKRRFGFDGLVYVDLANEAAYDQALAAARREGAAAEAGTYLCAPY